MKNDKQALEYNEKHNHDNKQPNNTRLTQFCKQPKLAWNHAYQIIFREIQPSCKMKNDKQA
jgi:hypothetical protein